jgi:5-(carboxyamino)imidazole ribonucleotide mutase
MRRSGGEGLKVIIAGAGGAAHLPGMAASMTRLPVLGVPVESKALQGMDSLLSIVQMPAGVRWERWRSGSPARSTRPPSPRRSSPPPTRRWHGRLGAWRRKQTDGIAEAPE